MLMILEPERPTSLVNLLVAIWNSCTLSCGKFISVPPTTSSLLSPPSTVMLPPRPKAPAEDTSRVLVFVGSKFVAGHYRESKTPVLESCDHSTECSVWSAQSLLPGPRTGSYPTAPHPLARSPPRPPWPSPASRLWSRHALLPAEHLLSR